MQQVILDAIEKNTAIEKLDFGNQNLHNENDAVPSDKDLDFVEMLANLLHRNVFI